MFMIWVFLLLAVSAASAEQMTAAQKQDILNTHNLLRAQTARGEVGTQPKASNMMLMEWNDDLAKTADTWVSQCKTGHDKAEDRVIPGYSYVGQNWAGTYNSNHSIPTVSWFNEFKDYTYSTKACSAVCGHYTQVVWAKTHMIGCAFAKCPTYPYHLTCNYAPAGNFNNEHPYQAGEPCTACTGDYIYCMGGVCATKCQCARSGASCTCTLTASSCQNGATFDSANCACKCASGFYGTRCESTSSATSSVVSQGNVIARILGVGTENSIDINTVADCKKSVSLHNSHCCLCIFLFVFAAVHKISL